MNNFFKKEGVKSVVSSILCILAGILLGFIIMVVLALVNDRTTIADAFKGLGILLAGPFSSGNAAYIVTNVGDMIFYAAPLIMTGLSVAVANICKERGIAYYPGCVTPTEIMQALELGINVVKFFPANVYGGLKALKALSAPFPQIKFIPTGGADLSNLAEFLAFEKVFAVGGSFMMKGDITANCKEICKIVG